MKVWKIFSDEGHFFGFDSELGTLISRVFKLGYFHRLKVMIGNLDSSKVRISIFILLIRLNQST
jgi:hypothetical protein